MIPILFYGTPEIARICLKALLEDSRYQVRGIVTQPDRPVGRKQILTPSPVKSLGLEHGIPVIQPERLKRNMAEFSAAVSALGPLEIAVVVAFGQILPEAALQIPRCGSLNLHASLLPRWRGAAPIQRAIMADDLETGVCLMQMDAGLDTGAVFNSRTIRISQSTTAGLLHDQLAATGAELITSNLASIVAGEIKSVPQSTEGVTYAEKITDRDALINWDRPAKLVSCQIRGLAPRPGAYTFLGTKRLKIFNCSADLLPVSSLPGCLHALSDDSLTIACNPGTLRIDELQLEGKTRVSVADFVKGNVLSTGFHFGSAQATQIG